MFTLNIKSIVKWHYVKYSQFASEVVDLGVQVGNLVMQISFNTEFIR